MGTNPLGPGKVNVTVNMPKSMKADLEKLAKRSGMRLGEFCRAVLQKALEEEVEFERYLVKKTGRNYGYKVAEEDPNKSGKEGRGR